MRVLRWWILLLAPAAALRYPGWGLHKILPKVAPRILSIGSTSSWRNDLKETDDKKTVAKDEFPAAALQAEPKVKGTSDAAVDALLSPLQAEPRAKGTGTPPAIMENLKEAAQEDAAVKASPLQAEPRAKGTGVAKAAPAESPLQVEPRAKASTEAPPQMMKPPGARRTAPVKKAAVPMPRAEGTPAPPEEELLEAGDTDRKGNKILSKEEFADFLERAVAAQMKPPEADEIDNIFGESNQADVPQTMQFDDFAKQAVEMPPAAESPLQAEPRAMGTGDAAPKTNAIDFDAGGADQDDFAALLSKGVKDRMAATNNNDMAAVIEAGKAEADAIAAAKPALPEEQLERRPEGPTMSKDEFASFLASALDDQMAGSAADMPGATVSQLQDDDAAAASASASVSPLQAEPRVKGAGGELPKPKAASNEGNTSDQDDFAAFLSAGSKNDMDVPSGAATDAMIAEFESPLQAEPRAKGSGEAQSKSRAKQSSMSASPLQAEPRVKGAGDALPQPKVIEDTDGGTFRDQDDFAAMLSAGAESGPTGPSEAATDAMNAEFESPLQAEPRIKGSGEVQSKAKAKTSSASASPLQAEPRVKGAGGALPEPRVIEDTDGGTFRDQDDFAAMLSAGAESGPAGPSEAATDAMIAEFESPLQAEPRAKGSGEVQPKSKAKTSSASASPLQAEPRVKGAGGALPQPRVIEDTDGGTFRDQDDLAAMLSAGAESGPTGQSEAATDAMIAEFESPLQTEPKAKGSGGALPKPKAVEATGAGPMSDQDDFAAFLAAGATDGPRGANEGPTDAMLAGFESPLRPPAPSTGEKEVARLNVVTTSSGKPVSVEQVRTAPNVEVSVSPAAPSVSVPSPRKAAREAAKVERREARAERRASREAAKRERKALAKARQQAPPGEPGAVGDALEEGWGQRGGRSSFRRNIEVWGFGLKSALKVVKANKSGDSAAKREAAEHVRDGLVRLGPTFVKLGQVVSTRTDILSPEFVEVLKTLQDDVPAFSGERAMQIVEKELGRPLGEVFSTFYAIPIAAASLGQVHRAVLRNGKEVVVKVQRAGLKELFDVDLKNLKKLATFLDKIDPKSDGADRDWAAIYDESARLLYQEIDYLNEAANAKRFQKDFAGYSWVKVPDMYLEHSTPRVLTMEYVESFKLTDLERVDAERLDRKLLATRTADAFLRQIVETGFFHSDPHPGNIAVNTKGQIVYYDFGMMGVLQPQVQDGFREFCTALFEGGPMISEIDLSRNAKRLVSGVEKMGVLAKGADRLAVEKLARFFMRSFKDKQLGKPSANIKQTLGSDLQTLTDDKGGTVFRFPSTFTFIFRAFASIDGIGKGLDPAYDISKLSQPFIERFINKEKEREAGGPLERKLQVLGKATGLNSEDINTAVTSPRRIQYIEETLRSMEEGTLKIRVRSLENEASLNRLDLQVTSLQSLLFASVFLSTGLAVPLMVPSIICYTAAAGCTAASLQKVLSVKIYDKKQKRYMQKSFLEQEKQE